MLDHIYSGSWRDTRGRASHIPWQPSTPTVPARLNRMLAGRDFCDGCTAGVSSSDRLKLRPLAQQMFSSSMLSELQLNRATDTSSSASASACLPERQDALLASATLNWSCAPGHRLANMWIWRPWTEGLERWKHSYNSSCLEPQASSGLRWNNSSDRCACPTAFCRPCFPCDAALLSHARPNVVFIFACDASSCTRLQSCAKLSSKCSPMVDILL